jgi:hypothetical protein
MKLFIYEIEKYLIGKGMLFVTIHSEVPDKLFDRKKGVLSLPLKSELSKKIAEFKAPSEHCGANPCIQNPCIG